MSQSLVVAVVPDRVQDLRADTPLVQALMQRVNGGGRLADAVRQLLAETGLLAGHDPEAELDDLPKIRDALKRLKEAGLFVLEPGERYLRLTTLADLDREIVLKLEAAGERAPARSEAVIRIAGEAHLVLRISALQPSVAAEIGLPVPAGDVLQRCALAGRLGTSAALARGVASIASDASAQAGVFWYFQRHRQDTVLSALVDAAIEIAGDASPWRLEQVRKVLARPTTPGAHLDALRAIDVETDARINFTGDLTLDRGFANQYSISGPDGAVSASIGVALNASLRFQVARNGARRLRMTLADSGEVELSLERSKARSRALQLGFGVTLGVDGLDTVANAWLQRVLPPIDPELKGRLDAWSRPGSLFKKELRERLARSHGDKWAEVTAVFADLLLGDSDENETPEAAATRLLDRWQCELDERLDLYQTGLVEVADRLLGSAGDEQAAMEIRDSWLRATVVDSLQATRNRIDAEVASYVDSLRGRATDALTLLLAPLAAVGERVEALAANLDARVESVISGLKELLANYESLRKRLTDAVSKAASAKLSASLSASWSREDTETQELRLFFAPTASDRANRLFRNLVLGRGDVDLPTIEEMVQDGVRVEHGAFSAYLRRGRSIGLSLDLFGLSFNDHRALSSEVRIEVDGAGRVGVFGGRTEHARRSSHPRSIQSARFTGDFDLIDPGLDRLPGVLALDFELLQHKHRSDRRSAQFLSSFVDSGLLSEQVAAAVTRTLDVQPDRRVGIAVSLTGLDGVLRNAALESRTDLERATLEECVRFLDRRNDGFARALSSLPIDVLHRRVHEARNIATAKRAATQFLRESGMTETGWRNEHTMRRELWLLHVTMTTVPDAVQVLGRIGELAARVREVGALDDAAARRARDQLDELLGQLNRTMTPLVDVRGALARLVDERLPDRVAALLAMMARLGGRNGLEAHVRAFEYEVGADGSITPGRIREISVG